MDIQDMLAIQSTNDPSPHVRRRAKTMKVKTLAFDSYLVTPKEPGKATRLVQFDMSDAGVVKVECVKQDGTGEVCEANVYSKPCSHVEAAIRRLMKNVAKLEKAENRTKTVKKVIKQTTSKRLNYG